MVARVAWLDETGGEGLAGRRIYVFDGTTRFSSGEVAGVRVRAQVSVVIAAVGANQLGAAAGTGLLTGGVGPVGGLLPGGLLPGAPAAAVVATRRATDTAVVCARRLRDLGERVEKIVAGLNYYASVVEENEAVKRPDPPSLLARVHGFFERALLLPTGLTAGLAARGALSIGLGAVRPPVSRSRLGALLPGVVAALPGVFAPAVMGSRLLRGALGGWRVLRRYMRGGPRGLAVQKLMRGGATLLAGPGTGQGLYREKRGLLVPTGRLTPVERAAGALAGRLGPLAVKLGLRGGLRVRGIMPSGLVEVSAANGYRVGGAVPLLAATGAGGAPGATPGTLAASTTAIADVYAKSDASIAAVRVDSFEAPDGARSHRVIVPGTQSHHFGGVNPADHLTNLGAMAGQETDMARGVRESLRLAGASAGDSVTLVGHSQGGIVAMNLAGDPSFTSQYRVTGVETYGSPVAGKIGQVTAATLHIEDAADSVPGLDGQENEGGPNNVTVKIDTRGLREQGGLLTGTHTTEDYHRLAKMIDSEHLEAVERTKNLIDAPHHSAPGKPTTRYFGINRD